MSIERREALIQAIEKLDTDTQLGLSVGLAVNLAKLPEKEAQETEGKSA